MKLKLTAFMVVLSSVVSYAQQTRQTNLYQYNLYSLNPAYAGYSGCTELNFSHLNQWVGIAGAPVTNFFNGNTRLGKNFGIGADMLIDRLGMSQHFSSSLGVSYGLTIKKEHLIRFGLGAGFYQLRFDPTDAIALEAGDVIVEGGAQSANALNTEFGVLYAFRGLELSFASQQVLETRSKLAYPNLEGFTLARHFKGFVSYEIPVSKQFTLKPSVMYKGIATQHQFDVNMDVNFNDLLFGGLGFRTDVGVVGRIGFNVRKLFSIGYSYEVPMMNLAGHSRGSHEILLGLKLCKASKEKLPNDLAVVKPDTITVVETITDTMLVERIDTVFIDNPSVVSDEEVKKVMFNASETLEFEFDKAIIRKGSYLNLDALVNALIIREDLSIKLAGHTDNEGTEEYNLKLSRDRVEAIKRYLVMNGIAADRVKSEYFGESKPIADNGTEEGRAKNRRVEMQLISK
jgi:type IX secretion system PorP/SprF family membrane protein